MKRIWLLFSQAVTVFVAAYFVVATLQPDWIRRRHPLGRGHCADRAPPAPAGQPAPGSLSGAARKAAPAVVSINTSKAVRHPRSNDPWFQFFFGDQAARPRPGWAAASSSAPTATSSPTTMWSKAPTKSKSR
jgi:serine protease DegQ